MSDRTVKVSLVAAIGQYEAAMAKAGLSTKSLGHTIDSISKGSEKSFKSMALGLTGIGGGALAAGAGAAVAGVAITKFARDGMRSYIELVDQVRAYKNVTGASAEESSRMVAVAKVLGVSVDTVANGMFRLSRQVVANKDALHADGVVVARNKDGQVDLSNTLGSVADAYQRAGAGAAGNKVVFDAFGRSGLAMIPILRQGREQLAEFWAEAAKHHEIITDKDLQRVFQYHVATRELKEAWTGLERSLGERAVRPARDLSLFGTDVLEGKWGKVVGDFLHGVEGAHHKEIAAANASASAEQKVADAIQAEKDKTDALKQGLDDLYASAFSVAEAQDKFNGDLADFADKVNAAKLAGDQYATSLDESTRTGRDNASMVRGLTKDIIDTANAARTSGADVEAATAVQRNALAKVLTQLGFNKTEAQKYADVLAGLDGLVVETTVKLDTKDALAKLGELNRQYAGFGRLAGPPSPDILAQHDQLMIDAFAGTAGPPSPEFLAAQQRQNERIWRAAVAANQAAGLAAGQATSGGPATDAARQQQQDNVQRWNDAVAQNARDALAQRDKSEAIGYEFGGINATDYKAYLQQRLAQTQRFSEEWAAIMHEIAGVNDDIGKGWTAAAQARTDAENMWMEALRREHEVGDLSTRDYLKQLEKRLAGLQKYSDEWMATWREIHQLKDDITQEQLDIIAAVDKQRQFDQAFYALASQRALSDLRAAPVGSMSSTVNNSRTWSPTFVANGSDATQASATNLQKMRDLAVVLG